MTIPSIVHLEAFAGVNFGPRGSGTNIIDAAQNLGSLGPGLNIGVIRGRVTIPGIGEVTNLGFLARALETRANANVLSRPNIQTLDNEEAKFLVGQNVPFQTGSFTQGATGATNPFQTFERRDIGTQLRVRPQISEGGAVRLSIYLEVSSIAPTTVQGQIVTNKRSFESAVIVDDGNFVVLSGLIEDRSSDSERKVPLLGDLPLIGLCALGGLTGRLLRALLTHGGLDLISASLIAVLCSTLMVGFLAERFRWPAVFVAVMAALPMVPGYFAIAGLDSLLTFATAQTPDAAQLSVAVQRLARAVFISVALVIGVIGPVIILQRQRERI